MAIFTCARWKPVVNHGGPMIGQNGLVLHHAVANGSLFQQFNDPAPGGNPDNAVSAHFWVSLTGEIEQYVDSETQAWHARQLNVDYCGVETEGCTTAPYAQPMTTPMIDALSKLYAEGHQRHGWPNALANAEGQRGFGYHRMAVNTACPCDVRLNERPTILAKAFAAPTPPPTHPVWPGRYLKLTSPYMQGTDVHTWQAQMVHRGWSLTADGIYGPITENVCRQFQLEKHLGVDGIVGPVTWDAAWTLPVT